MAGSHHARTRAPGPRVYCTAAAFAGLTAVLGCSGDLDDCDAERARTLVYASVGGTQLVATAGQALTHDSCGGGAFCHSSTAKGENRRGAPAGLDFDMIPAPDGLDRLQDHAGNAWAVVDGETMPPRGTELWRQAWRFHPRREDAKALPAIHSEEGKEIYRNWLACDAPIVEDTRVVSAPAPAAPDMGTDAGSEPPDAGGETDAGAAPTPTGPDWSEVYADVIEPSCVTSNCHDGSGAGGLVMDDECDAYEALLETSNCMDEPRMTPGDEDSYLVNKLSDSPRCFGRMPPIPLSDDRIEQVRTWVVDGAPAADCE